MSASSKARFALKMNNGSYHQNLFRDERHTHEPIVTRNGTTLSTTASKQTLSFSLGSILDSALKSSK